MIEIKTKIRKWGNSFGVVIPKKEIKKVEVGEGEDVFVFIKKEGNDGLRDTFGKFKFRKSTDKIMEEIDKDLDSGV